VSEPISILDVIKRGGFEASLITTFNATLPFYEEVVLRKLVGAGCRHNVVLMDRSQCAISWASEATRPRLAGHAYTLLPIGAPGAFHPKLCILVGPKKASILIGSHNLSLSGFGYNREVTNWIEVGGAKDAEGTALLAEAWRMASQWIEMERGKSGDALLEAALGLSNFVSPLITNAGASKFAYALAQAPGGIPLIDQLAERITPNITRIGVIGAFFDKELAFIDEIAKRWPSAELVIGIDPDSVQLSAIPTARVARYVDASQLWPEDHGYLHAKALYFVADDENDSAFISGSANPSRPAWMGTPSSCNVEAVLLRIGPDAKESAEATGLDGIFKLAELDAAILDSISSRSAREIAASEVIPVPLWTGTADSNSGEIRISVRSHKVAIDRAVFLGPDMQSLDEAKSPELVGGAFAFKPDSDVARIRSCGFYSQDVLVARAMIHHPSVISANSQSSRQYQIRSALTSLGASDGDISKVIASVERVIFADDTVKGIDVALREHKQKNPGAAPAPGPESLAISVADLPKERRKLRLLKSGDLAYLLDVLLRRLSEGLDGPPLQTDTSGRTEEGQKGTEGVEPTDPPEPPLPATTLSDPEIAKAVAYKVRTLTRRMVEQLKLATTDDERNTSAVLQLIAVLALLRELRHLDQTSRWKRTGQLLVEERDRRFLLDESLKYLLGSSSRLLEKIDHSVAGDTDEGVQLRVLLLWLAWDLGEELTEHLSKIWELEKTESRLRANAVFLKLIPPIVSDDGARSDLEQSISRTVRQVPEAVGRAKLWLDRHWQFGAAWSRGFEMGSDLRVGAFCYVPGVIPEPRVVLGIADGIVQVQEFDCIRKFMADRVVAISPRTSMPLDNHKLTDLAGA